MNCSYFGFPIIQFHISSRRSSLYAFTKTWKWRVEKCVHFAVLSFYILEMSVWCVCTDKWNTSTQQKTVHLLSSYTVLPVGKVDQKIWKKLHLHNKIWNESTSGYLDWRWCYENFGITKKVSSVSFVTVVVEPLSTRIVPVYYLNNFNNFSCILWTYIIYISSSVCFKDQFWTWGWPELGSNM